MMDLNETGAHVQHVPHDDPRTEAEIDAASVAGHDKAMVFLNEAVRALLEARLTILHECTGEGWRDFCDEIDGYIRPIQDRIETQKHMTVRYLTEKSPKSHPTDRIDT